MAVLLVQRRSFAIIVNAALAFAAAELITAFLHELCHALVARELGLLPRVYAFVEDNPSRTQLQDILITAAGPLGSLLFGLGFFALYRSNRRGHAVLNMLLCWLAILGVMTFINYLIVTPWLAAGDTAVIADRLGLGGFPRYGAALAGVALFVAFSRPATQAMIDLASPDIQIDTPWRRRRFIRTYFLVPFSFGIILVALAGIGGKPIYIFYGLLATIGNINIVAAAMGMAGQAHEPQPRSALPARLAIDAAVLSLYMTLVLFYVLVLRRGLPI